MTGDNFLDSQCLLYRISSLQVISNSYHRIITDYDYYLTKTVNPINFLCFNEMNKVEWKCMLSYQFYAIAPKLNGK
jgi:hypothetical protein